MLVLANLGGDHTYLPEGPAAEGIGEQTRASAMAADNVAEMFPHLFTVAITITL